MEPPGHDAAPRRTAPPVSRDVALHERDLGPSSPPLFSADDRRFLATAPYLLTAAASASQTRWRECARRLHNASANADRKQPALWAEIAGNLDSNEADLGSIIAQSDINATENLIHVIHSLLYRNWSPEVAVTGGGQLDDALANGRGAVLWVAHFAFSSLITKLALRRAGYPITHISRPEHGVSKSRFGIGCLNRFRTWAENRHLIGRIVHQRARPDLTRSAALETLANNGILSVTVGAWEGRHLATGDVLGARYTVSTGAAAFAFMSGAQLLPVFTTRRPDGLSYDLVIGEPLGETARSSLDEFLLSSAADLFSSHESVIRSAPDQWRSWKKTLFRMIDVSDPTFTQPESSPEEAITFVLTSCGTLRPA